MDPTMAAWATTETTRAEVGSRRLWGAGVGGVRQRADPKGEPIGKPWATLTALTTSARAR
jgi:hypothetical protein